MKTEIHVFRGGEWYELYTDFEPAMTFQINDFNDLANRQMPYSQAIRVPQTPQNNKAFGIYDGFLTDTDTPYRRFKCECLTGGVSVLDGSYSLEIQKIEKGHYVCQIVSGYTDVYSALKATPVSALDLGVTHWNDVGAADASKKIRYLSSASLKDGDTFNLRASIVGPQLGKHVLPVAYMFPYYPFFDLVEEAIKSIGFALETDVRDSAAFEKLYLSLSNLESDNDLWYASLNRYCTMRTLPSGQGAPRHLTATMSSSTFEYGEMFLSSAPRNVLDPEGPGNAAYPTWAYAAMGAYKMSFRVTMSSNGGSSSDRLWVTVKRYNPRGYFTGEANQDNPENYGEILADFPDIPEGSFDTDVFEVAPGERIHVEASLYEYVSGVEYLFAVSCVVKAEGNMLGPGTKFPISGVIGFKTAFDLFSLFVQLYGLMVIVDAENKVVKALTLSKWAKRILEGDVLDWSKKIILSEDIDVGYRATGYAKTNILAAEESEAFKSTDTYIFSIPDEMLDAEKQVLKIPVETARNVDVRSWTSRPDGKTHEASGRLNNPDSKFFRVVIGGPEGAKYNAGRYVPTRVKPHFVVTEQHPINIVPYIAQIPGVSTYPARFERSAAYDLGKIFEVFYAPVIDVLQRYKGVTAYFDLNAADIKNLDFEIPIYVEHLNGYFYVRKVSNYIPGQPTRVELVLLKK